MAYTESQAVTQVRYLINETSADFWSDTELTDWVQQGTLDLSTKLLCVVDQDDLTLATNQDTYAKGDSAWIEDLLKVKHAYYNNGNQRTGLQRAELHRMGHNQSQTGQPRYFYEWRGEAGVDSKIEIDPRPSATENGNTITFIYSKATTDITLIPDELQPIVFLYAASKAKIKDRLYQESALLMAQYAAAINFERNDKYQIGTDPTSEFRGL